MNDREISKQLLKLVERSKFEIEFLTARVSEVKPLKAKTRVLEARLA